MMAGGVTFFGPVLVDSVGFAKNGRGVGRRDEIVVSSFGIERCFLVGTEVLGVFMGHTLRDGCIVTGSSIDKQAARARSERVRDRPDPTSLATRW